MTPEEYAKNIIEEYGFTSVKELDIEKIAWAETLAVEEKPMSTHLGRIIFRESFGLISLSSRIKEPGQKRFTLAHELGHFFIEAGSTIKKFSCSSKDMRSSSLTDLFEQKANQFAAGLLMHKPWFGEFIKMRDINMELIRDIANYFGVSLSAAAIRYAEIGRFPIAVILSKKEKPTDKYGKVVWKSINEYFPFHWLPIGSEVNKDTAAADYFAGREMQSCEDLIPASAWFPDDRKCDNSSLCEQNIAMPNYNSVLTILWKQKS